MVKVLPLSESSHAVPSSPQDFSSPCEFVHCIHNTADTTGRRPHQAANRVASWLLWALGNVCAFSSIETGLNYTLCYIVIKMNY